MRVLFYGAMDYDREPIERRLPDYPDVEVDFTPYELTPASSQLAQGYQAVCAFVSDNVSAATLEGLHQVGVGLVLMRCAGFDVVDLDAARALGIRVTRVPAYSPASVAEHAMALAQAANRHIYEGFSRFRRNDFSLGGLVGEVLEGKTAGVVGTGNIGAAFARICKGYGMRVIANDLYPNPKLLAGNQGNQGNQGEKYAGVVDAYVSREELLAESDLISLHIPFTQPDYHMIDDAAIAQMREGVIFVNTSRGALVDTDALVRGLEAGKLGAVGLDVYEEEKLYLYRDCSGTLMVPPSGRLASFPNVVMTSHQAFFTYKSLTQIARVTLANAHAYAHGQEFLPGSVVC